MQLKYASQTKPKPAVFNSLKPRNVLRFCDTFLQQIGEQGTKTNFNVLSYHHYIRFSQIIIWYSVH